MYTIRQISQKTTVAPLCEWINARAKRLNSYTIYIAGSLWRLTWGGHFACRTTSRPTTYRMESLGADAVWTCNNGLCCHYPRSVCVRTAPGNVNMVAYGKINSRLSPVLIVQLSAAVTAGHRKAESFFTAFQFQRTPTGKVTSRITLFNINLDRVSLAVACTNNSSRYRPVEVPVATATALVWKNTLYHIRCRRKYRCLVTASGWKLSVVKYYVN